MITFDGGYGREGQITAGLAVCNGCNTEQVCVLADASDGEYQYACICLPCATRLVSQFVAEPQQHVSA